MSSFTASGDAGALDVLARLAALVPGVSCRRLGGGGEAISRAPSSGGTPPELLRGEAGFSWTQEDEAKHPRGKGGEWAKKGEGEEADEEDDPLPEWDGTIEQGEVERVRRGSGDYVGTATSYESGDAWETDVYIQEGTYDPFPERPDGELVDVYRWVATSEGAGTVDSGEWTADRDDAVAGAEEYVRENDEEAPEEEEEEEDEDGDLDPERMEAARELHEEFDDEAVHALLGLPEGARVTRYAPGRWESDYSDDVGGAAYGFLVTVSHPEIESCKRFVGVDEQGRRFIKNEELFLRSKGGGLGSAIFSGQVEAAAAQGFEYIRTHAAGRPGGSMNGYYTWPRFGYDESLESLREHNPKAARKVEEEYPDAESVLDVMLTEGGRAWWKANGSDLYDARFDLREGSRSRRVLDAYLRERAAKANPKR